MKEKNKNLALSLPRTLRTHKNKLLMPECEFAFLLLEQERIICIVISIFVQRFSASVERASNSFQFLKCDYS